jgi:hypothetical protein
MYENTNEFYVPYFELIDPQVIDNAELFREKLFELEILRPDDTEEEIKYFTSSFMIYFLYLQNLFSQKHLTFQMKYFYCFIRGTLCQRPKSQKDEWKSWIQAFYLH